MYLSLNLSKFSFLNKKLITPTLACFVLISFNHSMAAPTGNTISNSVMSGYEPVSYSKILSEKSSNKIPEIFTNKEQQFPMSRANWMLISEKLQYLTQLNNYTQGQKSTSNFNYILAPNLPQAASNDSKALEAITREVESLANLVKNAELEQKTNTKENLANQIIKTENQVNSNEIEASVNDKQTTGAFSLLQKYSLAAQDVVLKGLELIGTAYRYGGNTVASGLDCSGFVKLVFDNALGLALPRTAAAMSNEGKSISREELRAGDLVFFNTMRRAFSHVGIYMGDNTFLHAPRKGSTIRIEKMDSNYWVSRYNGARRVISIINGK